MHELPITQSVLEIVSRHAAAAGAARVTAIHLVVGEFTGFVPDSIQFYFDLLSQDTPAAGATLVIDRRPGSVRCARCGHTYQPTDGQIWMCPVCAALGGEVLAGKELFVESIEVAYADDRTQGGREDPERQ